MLTLLSQYLNGSYEIVEHAGPKTWVVKDKTDKKYLDLELRLKAIKAHFLTILLFDSKIHCKSIPKKEQKSTRLFRFEQSLAT